MARREKARGREAALAELLEAGDHGAAAAAARALRDDPAATPGERASAVAVLASLRPERGAVLVGVGGVVVALSVLAWTVLHGGHG